MKNSTALINSFFSTNTETDVRVATKDQVEGIGALCFLGCLLLAISSKIQVPFWPVPMTMQTFVVFIIGMSYGFSLASYTLIFYLLLGGIGAPVFAKGGGLLYLIGPTAGYLYGMVLAAAVIGYFADKGYAKSYFKSLLAILLGTILIFTLGVGYLGYVIGYDKALAGGFYPFIYSEAFKIALAVAVIPTIWKYTNK